MTSFVVATSGHVDHGKSTLVRALTGIEPDRWAEERRRGLTIDLGFAWMTLPSGRELAFVDVPGHERFLGNMLAGLGPAPIVLFVVGADQGWQPQSEDHLAAATALGIDRGVVALTRSDLADPAPRIQEIRAHLAGTGLADAPIVAVSGRTGTGLDELLHALDEVLATVPAPDDAAPVRMWIDRAFTISGAGTVVTGTLAAGTLRRDDEFALVNGLRVRVRGLQVHGHDVVAATGVNRVAVNLRGVDVSAVARGDALLTPGAFVVSDEVDVRRVSGASFEELPAELMAHIGTAAVPMRVRPFDADHARFQLVRGLPLHVGDRVVLRDPTTHSVVGGALVLDVTPPRLRRRGAGKRRADALAQYPDAGSVEIEVRRRGAMRAAELAQRGIAVPDAGTAADSGRVGSGAPETSPAVRRAARRADSAEPASAPALARRAPVAPATLPDALLRHGDWLIAKSRLGAWARELRAAVEANAATDPLSPGLSDAAAVAALRLPDPSLLTLVVRVARLDAGAGRVRASREVTLGPSEAAIATLERRLAKAPFQAPEADDLQALALGPRELAAAERAGRLLRIDEGVVLLPSAPEEAARILVQLPAPFTLSAARQALGTTRRVAVPLLELLDRRGLTRRLDNNLRELR